MENTSDLKDSGMTLLDLIQTDIFKQTMADSMGKVASYAKFNAGKIKRGGYDDVVEHGDFNPQSLLEQYALILEKKNHKYGVNTRNWISIFCSSVIEKSLLLIRKQEEEANSVSDSDNILDRVNQKRNEEFNK